ncbi:hypothetical protein [Solirubrobacter pauli]|nr:hypothetical protein [Solirubrobacter pauli]
MELLTAQIVHEARFRETGVVHSVLEIRSPSNGTGWADEWTFTGADDRLLRELLGQLTNHETEPPAEVWDDRKLRHAILADDRWRAAMLWWDDDTPRVIDLSNRRARKAWTSDGALQLADILPERFSDVRDAIVRRFAAS